MSLVSGFSFEQYAKDKRTQLAIERTLEIIGEAANKISPQFRQAHPEIPWRQIIGQRNVLIHDYGQVRHDRVLKVAQEYLPELVDNLRKMMA